MLVNSVCLLLIQQIVALYASTYCDQENECTDIMNLEENIFCRGYKSCIETNIQTSSNAYCIGSQTCANCPSLQASNVYCYGDTACSKAANIEATDGSVTCSSVNSCAEVSGNIIASNHVICSGVNSCNKVLGNVEANGEMGRINCDGMESCADIKGILSAYDIDASATDSARNSRMEIKNKAHIFGSFSAFNSEITAGGNIQCDGPYGCGESILSAHDDVRLFGFGSGYKAMISDTPIIYAYGYYAAAFSDIYGMDDDRKMSIQFHGHYSGYYANVWCKSGSLCSVSCRGSGCLEVVIFHEHRVDVSIDPIECSHIYHQGDVYEGINCPKLMQIDAKTKDEVEAQRMEVRERSSKWETLDDVYDEQSEPNSVLEGVDAMLMASDYLNVQLMTRQFVSSFGSFVVCFVLGCLFTCIGMRCCWSKNDKMLDAFKEPALSYM